jgi:hypothetical protein
VNIAMSSTTAGLKRGRPAKAEVAGAAGSRPTIDLADAPSTPEYSPDEAPPTPVYSNDEGAAPSTPEYGDLDEPIVRKPPRLPPPHLATTKAAAATRTVGSPEGAARDDRRPRPPADVASDDSSVGYVPVSATMRTPPRPVPAVVERSPIQSLIGRELRRPPGATVTSPAAASDVSAKRARGRPALGAKSAEPNLVQPSSPDSRESASDVQGRPKRRSAQPARPAKSAGALVVISDGEADDQEANFYEVEKVLDARYNKKLRRQEYLVEWKG